MRLLAFGGWGQLGSDLHAVATDRGHEVVRPRRADLDVRDGAAVRAAVLGHRPDAVVNAAAFHRTEACEREPETAFAVNSTAALAVARAAREAGARTVHVSTDYVFDGEREDGYREDDPVAPVNVYGVSKAAGERLVALADPNALVVRGSGMFGHAGSSGKGGNFVETMLARAGAGESLRVVDDQVFAPTATRDMAERLVLLLEASAPAGVYHLANRGRCTWFDLAEAALRLAGVRADLAPRPSDRDEVRRPRSSVLLDTRTGALGLPPARPWEEALAWYLEARASAGSAAGHRGEGKAP